MAPPSPRQVEVPSSTSSLRTTASPRCASVGWRRQLIGFEWAYAGRCPPTRTCGPIAAQLAQFDAAACFAVRTGSSFPGLRPSLPERLGLQANGPFPRSDPRRSGLRLDPHHCRLPVRQPAHLLRRVRLQLLPSRRYGLGCIIDRSCPPPRRFGHDGGVTGRWPHLGSVFLMVLTTWFTF